MESSTIFKSSNGVQYNIEPDDSSNDAKDSSNVTGFSVIHNVNNLQMKLKED